MAKTYFSVPVEEELLEHIKSLAHAQRISAAEVARRKLAELKVQSVTSSKEVKVRENLYGCPNPDMPCSSAEHPEAEQEIVRACVHQHRVPRLDGEAAHAYIARYWSEPALQPSFWHDLDISLGFEKDDVT